MGTRADAATQQNHSIVTHSRRESEPAIYALYRSRYIFIDIFVPRTATRARVMPLTIHLTNNRDNSIHDVGGQRGEDPNVSCASCRSIVEHSTSGGLLLHGFFVTVSLVIFVGRTLVAAKTLSFLVIVACFATDVSPVASTIPTRVADVVLCYSCHSFIRHCHLLALLCHRRFEIASERRRALSSLRVYRHALVLNPIPNGARTVEFYARLAGI